MRRHRPSASLVVATAALLIAVGGTAIAAVGAIPADGRFTACYQSSNSLLGPFLMALEKRALASDPPPVTVFAVCVRTLTWEAGKPYKPGAATRKRP